MGGGEGGGEEGGRGRGEGGEGPLCVPVCFPFVFLLVPLFVPLVDSLVDSLFVSLGVFLSESLVVSLCGVPLVFLIVFPFLEFGRSSCALPRETLQQNKILRFDIVDVDESSFEHPCEAVRQNKTNFGEPIIVRLPRRKHVGKIFIVRLDVRLCSGTKILELVLRGIWGILLVSLDVTTRKTENNAFVTQLFWFHHDTFGRAAFNV